MLPSPCSKFPTGCCPKQAGSRCGATDCHEALGGGGCYGSAAGRICQIHGPPCMIDISGYSCSDYSGVPSLQFPHVRFHRMEYWCCPEAAGDLCGDPLRCKEYPEKVWGYKPAACVGAADGRICGRDAPPCVLAQIATSGAGFVIATTTSTTTDMPFLGIKLKLRGEQLTQARVLTNELLANADFKNMTEAAVASLFGIWTPSTWESAFLHNVTGGHPDPSRRGLSADSPPWIGGAQVTGTVILDSLVWLDPPHCRCVNMTSPDNNTNPAPCPGDEVQICETAIKTTTTTTTSSTMGRRVCDDIRNEADCLASLSSDHYYDNIVLDSTQTHLAKCRWCCGEPCSDRSDALCAAQGELFSQQDPRFQGGWAYYLGQAYLASPPPAQPEPEFLTWENLTNTRPIPPLFNYVGHSIDGLGNGRCPVAAQKSLLSGSILDLPNGLPDGSMLLVKGGESVQFEVLVGSDWKVGGPARGRRSSPPPPTKRR